GREPRLGSPCSEATVVSTASHLSEGFTEMSRKTPTPLTVTLWTLIIVGLAAVQFPGILFYHDVAEPRIFGMPFIYGFNVLIWGFLCVVLLIAYRTRW